MASKDSLRRRLSRTFRISTTVLAGALMLASPAPAQQGKIPVDIELVLAVDISQSMDYDEHELQRNGYVDAFRHKDVVNAILSGPEGKIAVTYMEWAGNPQPYEVIPWTIIDSEKAARAFADRLAAEGIAGEQRTSISNALYRAADLIDGNDYVGARKVVDVSGDGANNSGPPVEEARDWVLKRGIVINGIPIMLNKPREYFDIDHLDRYYKYCVVGGPAAFIAPVYDLKQLAATIRKKLVMEIAFRDIEPGAAPIQFADAADEPAPERAGLQHVQLKLPTEKPDCFAGEKAMGGRGWGGYGDFPSYPRGRGNRPQ